MTFPADRQIATRFGLLDVTVRVLGGGRVEARLAPGTKPRSLDGTATAATEDEAVARLVKAIDRLPGDDSGPLAVSDPDQS